MLDRVLPLHATRLVEGVTCTVDTGWTACGFTQIPTHMTYRHITLLLVSTKPHIAHPCVCCAGHAINQSRVACQDAHTRGVPSYDC